MPITGSDLKFYLSGGASNADPDLSLGGVISSVEITDDTLNNLFDNVIGDEALAGDNEYRGLYIKNTHATLTLEETVAWILTNTPADDAVQIGIEASKGSGKQTIADESTAPTAISFSAAASKATGFSLGNLDAGDVYLIWIKRIVPAECGKYNNNYFEIKVEGDTAE